MSKIVEPWFVTERSEALAGLLLTSGKDVHVRDERKHESGVDFLVEIDTDDTLSTQRFAVQVRGTMSSDPNDWMRKVKPLFRGLGSPVCLPTCVVVVNVRDNTAFYAWVAEPRVEAKGATLWFHETGAFHSLDTVTVSDIVDLVKAWYQSLPSSLCQRDERGDGAMRLIVLKPGKSFRRSSRLATREPPGSLTACGGWPAPSLS